MNEPELQDRKLRRKRDLWAAVLLIGLAGVYVFGILSTDHQPQMIFFSLLAGAGVAKVAYATHQLAKPGPRTFDMDERGVSPVIAVILMVAITVVLAATVFVLVADLEANPPPPAMSFTPDSVEGTLTVVGVSSSGLTWGDLAVTGCQAPPDNTSVDAGDKLTNCTGDVTVVHRSSNQLVYMARFD